MPQDNALVKLLAEAILHLQSCAPGGAACPDCVKSSAFLASALADAVESAKVLRTAAQAALSSPPPMPPTTVMPYARGASPHL